MHINLGSKGIKSSYEKNKFNNLFSREVMEASERVTDPATSLTLIWDLHYYEYTINPDEFKPDKVLAGRQITKSEIKNMLEQLKSRVAYYYIDHEFLDKCLFFLIILFIIFSFVVGSIFFAATDFGYGSIIAIVIFAVLCFTKYHSAMKRWEYRLYCREASVNEYFGEVNARVWHPLGLEWSCGRYACYLQLAVLNREQSNGSRQLSGIMKNSEVVKAVRGSAMKRGSGSTGQYVSQSYRRSTPKSKPKKV